MRKLFNQVMGKTKIKASGITNLTDARYFAAREVEWLGFKIGDDSSSISLMAAKAIVEWVDGVKIVGEFEFATASEILAAHAQMNFDAVQVGMFTPVGELEQLPDLTIIKEVIVERGTTAEDIGSQVNAFGHCCECFLLDFTKSGISWDDVKSGTPISVGVLKEMAKWWGILLAFDLGPNDMLEIIQQVQPGGVSLMGGSEEKVGFKSFDELDEILDALESANSY